jgi:hypothetical protein
LCTRPLLLLVNGLCLTQSSGDFGGSCQPVLSTPLAGPEIVYKCGDGTGASKVSAFNLGQLSSYSTPTLEQLTNVLSQTDILTTSTARFAVQLVLVASDKNLTRCVSLTIMSMMPRSY